MSKLLRRTAVALFSLFLAQQALAQTGDPSFTVVNRSGRMIYAIFASPASDTNWGRDRLGRNTLRDGQNFAVRLPTGECVYDIRIVYDGQGGPAEERRGINTCEAREQVFTGQQQGRPANPPPAASANPSFNLVNNSGREVRELYASPSSDQNWGPNRLGSDPVAGGQTFPVRLPAGECLYDVRIVYASGEAQERRRVNLCEITNLTLPLQ